MPAADLRDDERRRRLTDPEQGRGTGRRGAGDAEDGAIGAGWRRTGDGATASPRWVARRRCGHDRRALGCQREDAAQHEGGHEDPGDQAGQDGEA